MALLACVGFREGPGRVLAAPGPTCYGTCRTSSGSIQSASDSTITISTSLTPSRIGGARPPPNVRGQRWAPPLVRRSNPFHRFPLCFRLYRPRHAIQACERVEFMRVLVTGATGHVGRIVVELLVAAGVQVRAMTRRPDATFPASVDTVVGDLLSPASLGPVLAGVDRMYLFPVAATAREVVAAAARAGVARVVVLSSAAVTSGVDTTFHLPVERAAEELSPEWTHVRPGEFMLNKLFLWGPSIRTEGVVYEPFPEAAWWPVHERDVADVAVTALLRDGHHGKAYDLSGPELLTRRQQVDAIAAATGRDVRLE